ncbi:hypothetical protein Bca4012_060339 [Brassica carinata]|uniref:Uncharacterized protein n=1 Tax=Brassica carinata TaxID=52824 RepID=A0A8X7V3F1_BRACI|nr:hypothetical protein Bca52824_030661 [Brassica carinata]
MGFLTTINRSLGTPTTMKIAGNILRETTVGMSLETTRPRANGFNGSSGRNGWNADATGDDKASQVNGHGNAQTRN